MAEESYEVKNDLTRDSHSKRFGITGSDLLLRGEVFAWKRSAQRRFDIGICQDFGNDTRNNESCRMYLFSGAGCFVIE